MFRLDFSHADIGRMHGRVGDEDRLSSVCETLHRDVSAGKLPALTLSFEDELVARLSVLEPKLRVFKHMIVLGIGGSALGARALQKAFFPMQDRPGHTGPWLWIADNIDAALLVAWMNALDPKDLVVVVISKSGGTIETLSQYFLVRRWLKDAIGGRWTEHMLFVTDVSKGYLREEADREGIDSLPVPDFLGGRYSVFSAVGMVPAAFLGMDWRAMLRGVANVTRPLTDMTPSGLIDHPAWRMASWAYRLWMTRYDQLIFFNYVPAWHGLGDWFAQLWAESLGKQGRGTMPIPAVGVTDQHSLQQMFLDGPKNKGCLLVSCPALSRGEEAGPLFPEDIPERWSWLHGRRFGELLSAECLGTGAALVRHDVPLLGLETVDTGPEAAGAVMGLCMAATLMTGWLMDIDPVDQPAVELGKRLACARLGAAGYAEERDILEAFLSER